MLELIIKNFELSYCIKVLFYYTLSYRVYIVQIAKLHIFLQFKHIFPLFFHIVGGYDHMLSNGFTLFEKQKKAQPQLLGVAP